MSTSIHISQLPGSEGTPEVPADRLSLAGSLTAASDATTQTPGRNGNSENQKSVESATEKLNSEDVKIPSGSEGTWPVANLKPYPFSIGIYGEGSDPGLQESVKEFGIQQPLIVDTEGYVISGHQRLNAALAAGLEKVPVIVKHGLAPEKTELLVLETNVARKKTEEQKLREYREFKRLESPKASDRRGKRKDIRSNSTGTPSGRARDIAADKVGLGSTAAEEGLKVLKAMEEHAESDPAKVARIRQFLNEKSIHAAWQEIWLSGWLPKGGHAPKKGKRPLETANQPKVGEAPGDQTEAEQPGNASDHDTPGQSSEATRQDDGKPNDQRESDSPAAEPLAQTAFGDEPQQRGPAQLRLASGVVIDAKWHDGLFPVAVIQDGLLAMENHNDSVSGDLQLSPGELAMAQKFMIEYAVATNELSAAGEEPSPLVIKTATRALARIADENL